MQTVRLSNGVEMPILGYGVYQINDEAECIRCVSEAIAVGYRSIDTAQAYGNEFAVGQAIQASGVAREELFITSKIWISNAGYDKALASIEKSLDDLGLEYLDLMLIHQPFNDYYGAYRALETMYKAGKIRAIGVSNFAPDRLIDLCTFAEIAPMVNQIETHVFQQQAVAQPVLAKYNVVHESWGPFAEGRKDFFANPTLQAIGEQYGKSVAQVGLRYLIQKGIVVIPKTVSRERMEQNIDVFDFELSASEMEHIASLDEKESAFFSHQDPATVEFMVGLVR